jgi:hypothetical protein
MPELLNWKKIYTIKNFFKFKNSGIEGLEQGSIVKYQ